MNYGHLRDRARNQRGMRCFRAWSRGTSRSALVSSVFAARESLSQRLRTICFRFCFHIRRRILPRLRQRSWAIHHLDCEYLCAIRSDQVQRSGLHRREAPYSLTWGFSSAGRAPVWQTGSRGFESRILHWSIRCQVREPRCKATAEHREEGKPVVQSGHRSPAIPRTNLAPMGYGVIGNTPHSG